MSVKHSGSTLIGSREAESPSLLLDGSGVMSRDRIVVSIIRGMKRTKDEVSQLHDRLVHHGFSVELTDASGPLRSRLTPAFPGDFHYVICLADSPFDPLLAEELAILIDRGHCHAAVVAFDYRSRSVMSSYQVQIEHYKGRTADRLNFVYPDELSSDGMLRASIDKLENVAISDTFRLGFATVRDGDTVADEAIEATSEFFLRAAKLFERYPLSHRASTDGCMAIKWNGGFLVTATRTDKLQFDFERVVWVHDFDLSTNTARYSGAFLPTSHTAAIATLSAARPHLTAFVHTHARKLLSENPMYRDLPAVKTWGGTEAGLRLAESLPADRAGLALMRDHGEFFTGVHPDGQDCLQLMESVFDRATRSEDLSKLLR